MSELVENKKDDPILSVPFASLRRCLPLLARLFIEAELDRRLAVGGDLYLAAQSVDIKLQPLTRKTWDRSSGNSKGQMDAAAALIQGALVFLCQPGQGNDISLSVTFPKFALALQRLSSSILEDRPFFVCLVDAVVKHKSKLPKVTRDAIIESWLGWLKASRKREEDTGLVVASYAHEFLIRLFNEWSTLGNLLLPRDKLLQFCAEVVNTVDAVKFAELWNDTNNYGNDAAMDMKALKQEVHKFASVRKQYERMLQHVPAAQAEEWKQKVGISQISMDVDVDDDDDDVQGESQHTREEPHEENGDKEHG